METLKSKTTEPELKDSKPLSEEFELKHREVKFNCEKHGEQVVKQVALFEPFAIAKCPGCVKDEHDRREQQDKERRERNAQVERERKIINMLKAARIPERFEKKGFDNFEDDLFQAANCKETCMAYAQNFLDLRARGTGIVMAGMTGTGKTHLACAIAKQVITKHAMSALYTTAVRAFRSIKATYGARGVNSEQDAFNALTSPDLLIMDEVGVSFGSDAEKMIFFDIVNERYEHMRPTILLSNLAMPAFTEAAGQRVVDRMKENGGLFLIFDWPSHRGNEK